MEVEKNSLAYELLQELKRSNKRWFIIAMIELVIIVGMIIGFFIYESQFEYVTTTENTQELTSTDSSDITQTIN